MDITTPSSSSSLPFRLQVYTSALPGTQELSDTRAIKAPDITRITRDKRIFITIDDLAKMAEDLMTGLLTLGGYRYPLAVRRGRFPQSQKRKGVMTMVERKEGGKILKAGARTYFFDIKETKQGEPFLTITESRFKGEDKDRERTSILVFADDISQFSKMVYEMSKQFTQKQAK